MIGQSADGRRVRVLVADEQPMVREGVHSLLDALPGIDAVGTAADEEEAVAAICTLHPDVVLFDIGLPSVGVRAPHAFELVRRMKARHSGVAVLLFPTRMSDEQARDAMASGANGVMLKTAPVPEVLSAVVKVAKGGSVVDPDLARWPLL